MKRLLPAILAIFMVTAAQAQTQKIPTSKSERKAFLKTLLQQQAARSAGKTTAIYWRVAASSTYDVSGLSANIEDSVIYNYSNARGSMFNYRELYLNDYGLYTEVLHDTMLRFRDMGSGLEKNHRAFIQYNSSNLPTEAANQNYTAGQFVNNDKSIATRDGNGNITKSISLYWNTGTNMWDTTLVDYFTYDSQDKMLSDSAVTSFGGTTMPAYAMKYTYDGSGNLTQFVYTHSWNGSGWDESSRATITYIGSNPAKTLYQDYVNSAWRNNSLDTMGYNGSGVYNYYEYREWDTVGNVWMNVDREIHTINSNGVPSLVMYAEWDGNAWETYSESDMQYDAYDNPIREISYNYTSGIKDFTPTYIINYYYQVYFNVGINDIASDKPVIIYPNPATSNINVVLAGQKDAHISLINMAGQRVRTATADNAQKASVNIAGLPAGNYILSVESTDHAPRRQMVTIQ